jgi:hypothetical protein
MQSKLKLIAAAAAIIVAGTASANTVTNMNSGNSSLLFFATDLVNTSPNTNRGTMALDLGKNFSDFVAGTAYTTTTTTLVWDFGNNTFTQNGIQQAITANWSAVNTFFKATADSANIRFGVIGGNSGGTTTNFLTTGAPTSANLTAQTANDVANMATVNSLYFNINNAAASSTVNTTIASTGFGGVATKDYNTNASAGVGGTTGMGSALNWQTNLKWSAAPAAGVTTSKLYFLDSNLPDGAVTSQIAPLGGNTTSGGLFTYDYANSTLTWSVAVAAVPEPGTYAMLLAGLAAVGMVAKRRSVR